jgi:hypothetical protein
MNLRVFAADKPPLLVEISSPLLPYGIKLCVPMFAARDLRLESIARDALITVRFRGEAYQVPFLLVESIMTKAFPELVLQGSLDDDDSRNILLNIRDILAWDSDDLSF